MIEEKILINMGASKVILHDDGQGAMILVSYMSARRDSFEDRLRERFPFCSVLQSKGSAWMTLRLKED